MAIAVFILLLAMATLHITQILGPIEDGLRYIFSPVSYVFDYSGTRLKSVFIQRQSLSECQEKNLDIERRIAGMSVDYVKLKALEAENEILRETLGYLNEQSYEAVMARVISRSVIPTEDIFIIDRGSRDGLQKGMAVIVQNGMYVGKISTIYDRTAEVTLTSDPSSRVAVSLAGQHRLVGLVEGRGNHTARATLIPHEEPLAPNDILVTSGTEEKVPADLVVAIVNSVIGEATDPFKSATLEPFIRTESLNLVAVLIPRALRPDNL